MGANKPSNHSLQCSVCGQWKRLTGADGNQHFYPCCGENGQYEHVKNVCDECCKTNCPYRPDPFAPKDTMIIYHQWYGIQPRDRWQWTAEINGLVYDYQQQAFLIKRAEEMKMPWIVIRNHRGGGKTIIKRSKDNGK